MTQNKDIMLSENLELVKDIMLSENLELVKILKNKKTGNFHCPFCLKKLKTIKIENKEKVLYCKKCKKYLAYPLK